MTRPAAPPPPDLSERTENVLRELAAQDALAREIIRVQDFKFTTTGKAGDLTDAERWEKLAFTFYTAICDVSEQARSLLSETREASPR